MQTPEAIVATSHECLKDVERTAFAGCATSAPAISATSGVASGEYLKDPEAAPIIGCSPRTLQAMRYAGTGPKYVRVGKRRVFYRKADLLDYLEKRRFNSLGEERMRSAGDCGATVAA